MNISISRDGIEIGEWTEEEVREFYREGRLVDADCYWQEGMTEWIPLSRLMRPPPPFPAPSNPASSPENPVERPSVVAPIVEPSVSSLPLTPLEGQLKAGFKSRIAARSIDMALVFVPALILAIPVFILFGFAQPEDIGTAAWGLSLLGQAITYDAAFLLWEVVWIGTIGTTPGKAIFGIKVVRRNGEQMQMNIAWKRVWRLFRSLGFLIVFPLTGLPIALRNQKRFLETGTTFWDEVAGTEVTGKKIGVLRKSIGTVLFIFSVLFWLSLFPSHLSSGSRSQTQPPVVTAPSTDSTPQTPAETPAQLAPSQPEPVTPSAPALVAPPPAPEPAAPPAVVKVASDNEEAAGYRIKATAGNAESARKLGLLYLSGQGVPQHLSEALKWLQVAADQGDADAQYELGFMYENGEAVAGTTTAEDLHNAVGWYKKAAAQGQSKAEAALKRIQWESY